MYRFSDHSLGNKANAVYRFSNHSLGNNDQDTRIIWICFYHRIIIIIIIIIIIFVIFVGGKKQSYVKITNNKVLSRSIF